MDSRKLEDLFHRALELPDTERDAFLDRECADDRGLRTRIEELLAADLAPHGGGVLALDSTRAQSERDDDAPHQVEHERLPAPGTQMERYRLLSEVGIGGMGVVYLARDTRLERLVAIKFSRARSLEDKERFLREARVTAHCRHENIVTIYEQSEYQGHPYMVLEFLEGGTLRDRMQAGKLSALEAVTLAIPVVRALARAHELRLVHRDLKPLNIMLDKQGVIKVMDFGLAKPLSRQQITRTLQAGAEADAHAAPDDDEVRALRGTVPYMSPEQWRLEDVDQRTDIWAVGIILFEMLAGEHPLAPLEPEILLTVADMDMPIPRLEERDPGLGELARIVDQCLRKRRKERVQSAPELLSRLAAWLQQESGDKTDDEALDPRMRALAEQLEDAYARKEGLLDEGVDPHEVIEEIVRLKREIRQGGQLRPGDRLGQGRYVLLTKLGRGGFATVWKARDKTTKEVVAIKVLHPHLAGDTIRRERFFRGARTMATLEHAAIARIRATYGEDDGYYYFVMEFLPGGTLHDAVLGGRISTDDGLRSVIAVGGALALAHERGYIHRDVKPQNILFAADGSARLVDFDLVASQETTGGTQTGAMGTVIYSAPELWERAQDADARADVYSLAMTALFVLHGKALPSTVIRDTDEFLATLGYSAAHQRAIIPALAWDRADRTASVRVFSDRLRRALERRGLPLPPFNLGYVFEGGQAQAMHISTLTLLGREGFLKSVAKAVLIHRPRENVHIPPSASQTGIHQREVGGITATAYLDTDSRLFGHDQPDLDLEILQVQKKSSDAPFQDIYTLGRIANNDLRVTAIDISKFHCVFQEEKGRWYLCDLRSRNGTYVEGEKLKPKRRREIVSGQLLGFGEVQCRFYTAADLYELLTDTGAHTVG